MGTVYMLHQTGSKPYRVVTRGDDGSVRTRTGWCKTFDWPQKVRDGLLTEGWNDGGDVMRGEGQDALFDLEEKDFSKTINGYDFGEVASSLQKDLRRGNEVPAAWWARELAVSGYQKYLWRRLILISVEDVGIVSPQVHGMVESLRQSYFWYEDQTKGRERWNQFPAMAVLLICRATKNREVDSFTWFIDQELRSDPPEIPEYALDVHTKRGRIQGRGYRHFYEEAAKVIPEGGTNEYEFVHAKWIKDQEEGKTF